MSKSYRQLAKNPRVGQPCWLFAHALAKSTLEFSATTSQVSCPYALDANWATDAPVNG